MDPNKKIGDSEVVSVFSIHYPNSRVVDIEDLSSGCDNWIFCVLYDEQGSDEATKVILRFPRKLSNPDCPVMHRPRFQAKILNLLGENGIPCPKLLHVGDNYLIESYVTGIDLAKVQINCKNQLKKIFTEIGFCVKKLHSIDCCENFGYIVDIDQNRDQLIGKYDNWLTMFEEEFPANLKNCLDSRLIDQKMFQLLDDLYSDVKPYLMSYSVPRLLHSDICGNNIRIVTNSDGTGYQFNGLIDFADCMSGDPMFDLGELLLSYYGDYTVIDMFETGYRRLSAEDKHMIRFYAIHYNLWLLDSSEDTDKWMQTLHKLVYLKT